MKIVHGKLNDIFVVGVFLIPLVGFRIGGNLFYLIFFLIFVKAFL